MLTMNKKGNQHIHGAYFCSLALSIACTHVNAQSVPADLLDLSIDELLSTDIQGSDGSVSRPTRPWSFRYSYDESRFKNYLDGTNQIPVRDVLFSPGEEPRTDKNFPVVPTDITQEIHSIILGYELKSNVSLSIAVPYIKQSTDHISIVPGYSTFNISSDGIGDVAVLGNYRFSESITGRWQAGMGVSFPTGSIDEKGDTPRAAGKQQLPYTMQLGSGTYDVPYYVSYLGHQSVFNWGVNLSGKVRLGENSRDYHLGNTMSAATWLRLTTLSRVQPSIKLSYRYWTTIHGEDTSLSVPGPYPYPAPVVDPSLFGGDQVSLSVGFRIPVYSPHRYVDLIFSKPVYQSLNGPQTSEDYRFSIAFSLDF
jgi:hypothetical protein